MKIELKHLAPYLPFQLMTNEGELTGLREWLGWCGTFKCKFGETNVPISAIKPILHPLSDLAKDEYNFLYQGEVDPQTIKEWIQLDPEARESSKISYSLWTSLLYYHFDVFGLIDKGLAINIESIS